MRIAILTPHFAYNYGALLQAFALLHFLRSRGHDVWIINRRPTRFCALKRWSSKSVRRLEELTRGRHFEAFQRQYLQPQTELIAQPEQLKLLDDYHFDAVVVGSDQVWRIDYAFVSFGDNLFLDFVDRSKTKKIAYAPSFGKNSWEAPPETVSRIKARLEDFTAISVREAGGVELCRTVFDVEATQVLDPTLLHDESEYRQIFKLPAPHSSKPYLFTYLLDGDSTMRTETKAIAQTLNLSLRHINPPDSPGERVCRILSHFIGKKMMKTLARFRPQKSVLSWLRLLAGSEFVVTNSFHDMCFAIIFHKQFIVFGNEERGMERFYSVLRNFGLEDRLLKWGDNWKARLDSPIDYQETDQRKKEWQTISETFFTNALGE